MDTSEEEEKIEKEIKDLQEVKSISTSDIINEFFRRMRNLEELTIIKTKKQQASAAYNSIKDIYRKNK